MLGQKVVASGTSWMLLSDGTINIDLSVYPDQKFAVNSILHEAVMGCPSSLKAIALIKGGLFKELIQKIQADSEIFKGSSVYPNEINGENGWVYCHYDLRVRSHIEGIHFIELNGDYVDTFWQVAVPEDDLDRLDAWFRSQHQQDSRHDFRPEVKPYIRGYSYEVDNIWNIKSAHASWPD